MSYWYLAHENELLLDIDEPLRLTKSGAPWIEIFFRRRLRAAIESKLLDVKRIFAARSNSAGHYHICIELQRKMPVIERLVWQIHLGSDLYRGRADLMRAARGYDTPSLLIAQEPWQCTWRNFDVACECTAKHITSEQAALGANACPTWLRYRGYTPWELFGAMDCRPEGVVGLTVGNLRLDQIMERCYEDEE